MDESPFLHLEVLRQPERIETACTSGNLWIVITTEVSTKSFSRAQCVEKSRLLVSRTQRINDDVRHLQIEFVDPRYIGSKPFWSDYLNYLGGEFFSLVELKEGQRVELKETPDSNVVRLNAFSSARRQLESTLQSFDLQYRQTIIDRFVLLLQKAQLKVSIDRGGNIVLEMMGSEFQLSEIDSYYTQSFRQGLRDDPTGLCDCLLGSLQNFIPSQGNRTIYDSNIAEVRRGEGTFTFISSGSQPNSQTDTPKATSTLICQIIFNPKQTV